MDEMKAERWYGTRKVAVTLDVSPRTVARWIRKGDMKAVKIGRIWRVKGSEVDRFASQR